MGGSTGTNFIGVLQAAQLMRDAGRSGSIVTILCDSGERYAHSYYNPEWYPKQGIDVEEPMRCSPLPWPGRGCRCCPASRWKRCTEQAAGSGVNLAHRRAPGPCAGWGQCHIVG